MFGFGKKKRDAMLAEHYAINMVTLSISMKNTLVQMWNSYRHLADLEPLEETDKELFEFFALYNFTCCAVIQFNKLNNHTKDELNFFNGLCVRMYPDSTRMLDIPLPEDFSLQAHIARVLVLHSEFAAYGIKNPKPTIFEELIYFFVYEMKSLSVSSETDKFCAEITPQFQSIHRDGWDVIQNSSSFPVIESSTLETIRSIESRLPE